MLALLAAGAAMAVFISWYGRVIYWACAALFLIALAWPWLIALGLGLDAYTTMLASHFSGLSLLAVTLGAFWGLAARRVTAGALSLLVAGLPALAGAGYVLERQRVPDAPCAERALFDVGDLSLEIPRGMSALSAEAKGGPEQAWEGSYGPWSGAKPEIRRLCLASDGGRRPVELFHLWVSFNWFKKAHREVCEGNEVPDDFAPYCAAVARTELTVVQLYARSDGMPIPTRSHFNYDQVVSRLSAGETSGALCKDSTLGPQTRYCTIWLPLTPDVLAVSTAKLGPVSDGETPVADAQLALRTLLERLSPQEGQ
ncbi:MAG: hypothetical protein P8X61_07040 [Limibacillus sp.]